MSNCILAGGVPIWLIYYGLYQPIFAERIAAASLVDISSATTKYRVGRGERGGEGVVENNISQSDKNGDD